MRFHIGLLVLPTCKLHGHWSTKTTFSIRQEIKSLILYSFPVENKFFVLSSIPIGIIACKTSLAWEEALSLKKKKCPFPFIIGRVRHILAKISCKVGAFIYTNLGCSGSIF